MVPTESYTRAYTLADGSNSPVRQGIAVAGVTLPELPQEEEDNNNSNGDRAVTTPAVIVDPQDPDFIHPLYRRIAAICPCC